MRLNRSTAQPTISWLAPNSSHNEGGESPVSPAHGLPQSDEDLPYKVELWDATNTFVEELLAVATNVSIGYAAYYAAARQFPDRYITLRHRGAVISRWNGPGH